VLAELASLLPEGEYPFVIHANYEWAHRT
jgi:hypothetical protein